MIPGVACATTFDIYPIGLEAVQPNHKGLVEIEADAAPIVLGIYRVS